MIGTANWDPSSLTKVYSIKGVPVSESVSETLSNAGNNIDFGTDGTNYNAYFETYNSYLKDAWAVANNATWTTGNLGRNIYQFGNPYLTNLDLSQIVRKDGKLVGDGNEIGNTLV